MRNLIFDNNSTEISAGYNIEYNTRNIWKERYDILIKLLNFDFSTIDWPNEICIYGCGNIGTNFYEKIKDFTVVRYFIDRRWCKKGGFNGIPVLSPENTSLINNQKVIVTATYDYDNICKSIKQTAPNADVISVLELMQ